ncbi:MAG: endonuclease [Elusimicrobia bacterium CG08_land_8_20_14_0_20_51_18]|nr:MAG: endonuclease [Elusimicrobia bacterium CG08_land_8_20_14_0_20_51_18]
MKSASAAIPDLKKKIKRMYGTLYRESGPQGWWPVFCGGRKPLYRKGYYGLPSAGQTVEICFGALLTQNASWKNAEKALINLKKENLLDFKKIDAVPARKLQQLIRSSGYYRQKALRLKLFSRWALSRGPGGLGFFFSKTGIAELRKELLAVKGVGPETADSIMLYAALKPSFVIDAYTKRIYSRYFSAGEPGYDELKRIFEEALGQKRPLYAEFHALLVELAKRACHKKTPECRVCVLKGGCGSAAGEKK